MKIYVVVANNGWGYCGERSWNAAVFASEEAARKFVRNFDDELLKAEQRGDELEELGHSAGLTDAQAKELADLHKKYDTYWHFENGTFQIEEHELQE